MDQDLPVFLNIHELARQLHMTERSAYRLIKKDVMTVYRPGRSMLFRVEDVITFLETTRNPKSDTSSK